MTPPLVLVHGFMGGGDQWALQAPLGGARKSIAVDLPGFGRNAHMAPLDSIPAYADWVLSRIAEDRFDLLGHSMGGMIAQEVARRAPGRLRRLVLYSTGSEGVIPGRFEPIETSMERARAEGPRATARRIAATWFLAGEAAPEFAACARIAEASSLGAILAGLEAMRRWSGRSALTTIAAPTLVIWGDGDRTYGWPQIEPLWQRIPDCQLAVLPACAHAVHMERPALFNQLVGAFLDSAEPRTTP